MADSAQTRSEAPTPRKREEARKQGQVAFSGELTNGLMLLAGVTILLFASPNMGSRLCSFLSHQLRYLPHSLSTTQTVKLATIVGQVALGIGGTLMLGAMLTGIAANLGQFGFQITPEKLLPKWSRLSPASGFQRIFSRRAVMRGIWAILKISVVGVAVPWAVVGLQGDAFTQGTTTLLGTITSGWQVVLFVGYVVAGVQICIGLFDFLYQRWQHEEDLRMSRQEVLEEHKREEGDPQLKPRLRRLRREAVMAQQMLREVPTAAVVLTNPTHFAVAIRYDRGDMHAPQVIAKGQDLLARRIAATAREHGVPVLERKPLARALYASVEVGEEIPVTLYQAIAEVLAYVYRLS